MRFLYLLTVIFMFNFGVWKTCAREKATYQLTLPKAALLDQPELKTIFRFEIINFGNDPKNFTLTSFNKTFHNNIEINPGQSSYYKFKNR